ncbi:acyclic terpene utilization AtuA family protein [Rhodococcus artemisiae]|uniref:Acyclic terpene utilization AtuA family protein n=1 Tax=Rhodococcus artemisiae TaxID=714159 RepID=A0ABU7LDT1_9NOCA|nr:acyclic terpene utilization AtuA family protein [Rhodococcus artemisiae]MEE2059459.1 acyclic terpene utilization AtuA family protein [Rhodococcus artemisiae]
MNRQRPAVVRIGNCSGFYGDRLSAMREMLEGGELDYLTGDYLAELTMLILGRDRMKDPAAGYAKTFLRQAEECMGLALDKGVRLVANAGGLNPAGLAAALRDLAGTLGLAPRIAHVEGDDLIARVDELGLTTDPPPLTANAYLGAWGIVDCLNAGADIIVTGRVTDASVIVGPAAAHFDWARDEFDALAGAVAAGHVIECGTQATGGNYAFFTGIDNLDRPGFPIAEIEADGSSTITKHPGTGGAVTVGTVTAQLLYEVTGGRYAGPDVTTRIDTVHLEQVGSDRVKLTGVRGEAPPPTLKVCLNALAGFHNQVEFVLTGLDVEAKAQLMRRQVEANLPTRPAEVEWALARTDHPDADTEEAASALLRCTVRDPDPKVVGRGFTATAVEFALAGYPGLSLTAPPGPGSAYGVYTAGYVDAADVPHVAVLPDDTRVEVPPADRTSALDALVAPDLPTPWPDGPTRRGPLGAVAGARSGDKGGDANIGVWVRSEDEWRWLANTLTVDLIKTLLPETAPLNVTRHLLPNLRAVNFVIEGILGRGVASRARFDPQAKGLGEWLRARHLEIPIDFLEEHT